MRDYGRRLRIAMEPFAVTRHRYARAPSLPPLRRKEPSPPFARRCPSGEYEVMQDGLKLAGEFDNFAEADEWIKENFK